MVDDTSPGQWGSPSLSPQSMSIDKLGASGLDATDDSPLRKLGGHAESEELDERVMEESEI